MICAWQELLSVLPQWLSREVYLFAQDDLQELRLRINAPPEIVRKSKTTWLDRAASKDDIHYIVNTACRYSPWAASGAASGYITAPGGHRIGLCGEVVQKEGRVSAIKNVTSLCIRVARDFPGIANGLSAVTGSILIIGAPGWGKTTLLRDLIRQRSENGQHICVVDERCELFPDKFGKGCRTDILTGCPKGSGISMALRTMSPDCIAVDEITDPEDTDALISSAWCGVKLLATAHASSLEDFKTRPIYKPLSEHMIFDTIVILHRDKTWHKERSKPCITNGSALCS